MSDPPLDPRELRRALGAFATGVTIVTTRAQDGRPLGMTVNSFNSVSLDPPLVLWSLALSSQHLNDFRTAREWAVHILAADQEALSTRFATPVADRFAGVPWHAAEHGAPLLEGCSARFVCNTEFEYEGGDHAIFVGRVIQMQRAGSAPLIYHGGRYRWVLPQTTLPAPLDPHDAEDFGRHFIGHLLGRVHHDVFADVRQYYRARGLRGREYTVLVSLGMGNDKTRAELAAQAARGGVDLPQDAIETLIEKQLVTESGVLHLTDRGRHQLAELIAVAHASQLRMQSRLTQEEMGLLIHLLDKLAAPPSSPLPSAQTPNEG